MGGTGGLMGRSRGGDSVFLCGLVGRLVEFLRVRGGVGDGKKGTVVCSLLVGNNGIILGGRMIGGSVTVVGKGVTTVTRAVSRRTRLVVSTSSRCIVPKVVSARIRIYRPNQAR